ncbi:MAG: formate--tetrahydrofolate ligase [Treponema sp.]|uniref:formate--tetrahydrofolate ligase n=1 Tax=Treponema sp. TaxID=166 RepID=UPI0025E8CD89|nr:formate--tetrahydrofolate ligase [Treponema sp.]MBQ9281429.1 formate--tetrahydrofolate ligase [Treponema sp.]
MTDIEIAQKNKMIPIVDVAGKIGLTEENLELYGKYKAKVTMEELRILQKKAELPQNRGKLILTTALTPTPAGEGKSTVSIALGDGLNKIGKKAVIALREPSLGPCFGVKGGACGGGYAQIVPMEDINLHFTGDIHAIGVANNLIAALIDNHIKQGNQLGIDPRTISWKRCVDLNDRELRNIVVGMGGIADGMPREDHFCITVASELMAIICLSTSISDLKNRIDNITVAKTFDKRPVKFGELKCTGSIAVLLKDAIKPNLVQTLEKNPVFVHGGPFANIAQGTNSVNATICALATGDYVVTEAGFAADLGAEKFMDIKCRAAGISPSVVVIVATVRALKMHGGMAKADLSTPSVGALQAGFENLAVHIENIAKFGVPSVVAINKFITDTDEEINLLKELCAQKGSKAVLCEGWGKGGDGATELAKVVAEVADSGKAKFNYLYPANLSFVDKIKILAKEIYRAKDVEFAPNVIKKLREYEEQGYKDLPVCVAKTQNSISHDPKLMGAPKDYIFPIRDVQLYSGAGFVVALAGEIMTMPGLPKMPAALNIDIDDDGNISGLF